MSYVLIAYYSATGEVDKMAKHVARGVAAAGSEFKMRAIEPIGRALSSDQPVVVTQKDLADCQGFILGSPTRFGVMASPVNRFFDQTAALWTAGSMIGKPAAVFSSSSTADGGQATLLNLVTPLLHHGMMVMGLPYQGAQSPYGAHASEAHSDEEMIQRAFDLGYRIAEVAKKIV